jgi:hypothetical protein
MTDWWLDNPDWWVDAPYLCGGVIAYVKQVWQGTSSQKVYRPMFLYFTDAVVFIRPPLAGQLAKSAAAIVGGVLTGYNIDNMVSFASAGVERQVERVNDRWGELLRRAGANITYHDVLAEYGDWAEMWPNDRVVEATMKTKTRLLAGKYISVKLKPTSGLARGYEDNGTAEALTKQVLKKAFGTRFRG